MFRATRQGLHIASRRRAPASAVLCAELRHRSKTVTRPDHKQQQRTFNSSLGLDLSRAPSSTSHLSQIFPKHDDFSIRHIGPNDLEKKAMLDLLGMQVSFKLLRQRHCLLILLLN